jgi:hypothetical protein
MRRSRGRLTLGVHKFPFLEFSPITQNNLQSHKPEVSLSTIFEAMFSTVFGVSTVRKGVSETQKLVRHRRLEAQGTPKK